MNFISNILYKLHVTPKITNKFYTPPKKEWYKQYPIKFPPTPFLDIVMPNGVLIALTIDNKIIIYNPRTSLYIMQIEQVIELDGLLE